MMGFVTNPLLKLKGLAKMICKDDMAQDITNLRHAEDELIVRAHQQEVIVELGHRALANNNLEELMDAAVTLVANTLGVSFCSILEFFADDNSFLLKAGVGWDKGLVGSSIIQAGMDSQAGYTLLSREPVVVNDIREETRFSGPSILADHGVISGTSVTIGDQENPYGVLGAHAGTKRIFSANDIKFLQAVSNILAEAIERKKSENTLLQTKQDWEDTFNTITDMVTVHDKDYNIIRANKAAEKILGLPFLAKSNAKCFQYYHGTDAPPEGCPSCNCLKTKEPATFNMFEPHLNKYIEISSIPRIDVNKQLVGLIHIVRDISERKKDEPPVIKVSGIFVNGNGKNRGSHSSGRDSYEITVEDNGIGFDEKYTDRIFGVFQRLHGRSEYEGTGIGLSICKKIVARHNGTITAQSAPGKGARFIVVLPIKQIEGITNEKVTGEVI